MTAATLTLGQNNYKLKPYGAPLEVEGKNFKWEVDSKSGKVIENLTVRTAAGPSHSIEFESGVKYFNLDTTGSDALDKSNKKFKAQADGSDKVSIEGAVANATIVTGSAYSTGGDTVALYRNVMNTVVSSSTKGDSVGLLRGKGNVSNTAIFTRKGADTVTIGGKTKLGTGVVIDLGKDSDKDIISVADKSVFNKTTVVNFVSGKDQIKVGNTTYTNKSDIKKVFGNDIIFTDT
jgi:hypothetical protein